MTNKSSNFTGRSNNGHIITLPLFYVCRNADTILWRRFTRWRPHSTQSISLFALILDDTTTIKCFFEAYHQICSTLAQRIVLHFWPRGIIGAASDAIRHSSRLSKHGDTRLWEEVALGKNRISHEMLDAQQYTTHYFLPDSQPIQIDRENFFRSYWSTKDKCC